MDAFCPGVNNSGKHDAKTPEAVLIELCEEQRLERSPGRAVTPAFDTRDSNLDFEELFNRYRELQALQSNFEHLSAHEARVLCRNLDIHARAMEAYRPQPIGIPLHLFVASEQPASWPLSSASLGWERCVPAHLLHAQTAPGNHHSMMKLPRIKVLDNGERSLWPQPRQNPIPSALYMRGPATDRVFWPPSLRSKYAPEPLGDYVISY